MDLEKMRKQLSLRSSSRNIKPSIRACFFLLPVSGAGHGWLPCWPSPWHLPRAAARCCRFQRLLPSSRTAIWKRLSEAAPGSIWIPGRSNPTRSSAPQRNSSGHPTAWGAIPAAVWTVRDSPLPPLPPIRWNCRDVRRTRPGTERS